MLGSRSRGWGSLGPNQQAHMQAWTALRSLSPWWKKAMGTLLFPYQSQCDCDFLLLLTGHAEGCTVNRRFWSGTPWAPHLISVTSPWKEARERAGLSSSLTLLTQMQKRGGWRRKKGAPSRMLFSRLASLRSADKSPFSLFHFLVTRPWADLDTGVNYTHGLHCALHRRVVLRSCFIKESHFFLDRSRWVGERGPEGASSVWPALAL